MHGQSPLFLQRVFFFFFFQQSGFGFTLTILILTFPGFFKGGGPNELAQSKHPFLGRGADFLVSTEGQIEPNPSRYTASSLGRRPEQNAGQMQP